ncbi:MULTISPECIES: hypothetical protein [unclassified Mesorhizobium]|uniref:hypothetical protein n=1 Tax=unclassified Mesorhizobium TaxID=325217 RepID=UPI00333738DD
MDNFYETPTLSAARSGKIETSLCLLDNPDDVINHPRLSRGEKRALLSSWASDACAVENQPALRRLDNGTVIPVDQILRALKALDEKPTLGKETSGRVLPWRPSTRRSGLKAWRRRGRSFGPDDDDDPPPCPAVIAPRPRPPRGIGAVAGVELACA